MTCASDIVPYFESAAAIPATAPGTPDALYPMMLSLVGLPAASRYMLRLAASGATSR